MTEFNLQFLSCAQKHTGGVGRKSGQLITENTVGCRDFNKEVFPFCQKQVIADFFLDGFGIGKMSEDHIQQNLEFRIPEGREVGEPKMTFDDSVLPLRMSSFGGRNI